MRERVADARLEVVQQILAASRRVRVANRLRQDRRVAGLLHVRAGGHDEPEVVVEELAADLRVSLPGQRLVLMKARSVGELRRGEVEDPLPRPVRDQVHEAENVLIGVAEAHAAADPGLEQARRARQVEGRHALVLVPRVQHPGRVRIGALHLEAREQLVPARMQACERVVDRPRLHVAVEQLEPCRNPALVDVGEEKRERLRLAGPELQLELVGADRVPAVRDAPGRSPGARNRRLVQSVVDTDERVARGVEACDVARAAEERHVRAPGAVLRRVEDRRAAALDLYLADRVGALEVRHVVERLVEAELDVGEEAKLLCRRAGVADGRPPDLDVGPGRDEEAELDLDAALRAQDARVAQPVPALVAVERRLRRLPTRIPDRVAVADVEVAADGVERRVVVAVARQPTKPRVAPERVAAPRVRAETEEIVLAEVVEPRKRRVRPPDHVFPSGVVERAVVAGHLP